MEAFEWEEREDATPFTVHMIAGSLAGISEHLSMIPIDNVKTHCQVGQNMSITQIVSKIYKAGGLINFYSGSSVVAIGCAPAHAIYFSIYQKLKHLLNCKPEEDLGKFALIGAISVMFHDLIMTPTEVLKQRMQLMRSENSGLKLTQITSIIYKQQGFLAFYRSFPVNYAMNIPFGSLVIMLNEKFKHLFGVKDDDNGWKYYLCGSLAGGFASIPTTPLDVIKTRLNTQHCNDIKCQKMPLCNILKGKIERLDQNMDGVKFRSKRGKLLMINEGVLSIPSEQIIKYRNVTQAVKIIYKREGVLALFKGIQMRVLIQSVSSGIAWGTYQIVKKLIIPNYQN